MRWPVRLPRPLVLALVIGLSSGGSLSAHAADSTDAQSPEPGLPEASALRLETALRESSLDADVPRPTFARGDRMSGRTDRELTYEGNAEIRRGGTSIRAERITHYEADDEVVAVGQVRVAREGQVFTGPQLQIGLDSMRGQFESARFSIALNGGRGRAERVEFLSRSETVLTRAVYTSCLAEDPDWYLKTERLEIDQERDEGKATWPTLYFGDVPIFTVPQATFGLTEGRHSGFMSPAFGQSSKVGLEFRMPYYWDIAPNRDLLMSFNYAEKRGFQVGGMARYLEPAASGTTFFEYTANDQTTGTSRWMLNSMHTTTNWQGWSGGWVLRGVSDDQYFVDYARSITQSAERSLPRNVFVARGWGDWAVRLNVMQYQNILEARNAPPYDRLPQLTVTGARRDFGGVDLSMTLDTNNFRRDLAGTAQGWRMTANPAIAYPIGGPSWYVTPKAMVHASAYRLDENPSGAIDIDRVIPTFSLDSGMVFERPVTLGGRATIQTLEPRLFYVYTPYRDQSNIPVFDSGVANLSFATLFTENNFVGSDRISDANQLTTGVVSRFIDADTGAESLRLALAQRQYFSEQRVTLPGVPARTDSRSDILMAASGALGAGHWLDVGAQFSLSTGNMPRLGVGWRWWPSAERLFNIALRYQEKDYAQIDTSWRWPITGRWTTLGRINYSVLKEQFDAATGTLVPVAPQLLEGLAGFEYKQDCWALRLVAQRFITASATRTTSISLQFELTGFARVGLDGFENILLRNIPGYRPAELRPVPMSKFHGYE